MPIPIFPISNMFFPLITDLEIDGIINSFGDAFEQRIITGLPRGPRADGEGDQSTFIGVNIFTININNLQYITQPVTGNANLDNSVRELWKFYKDRFYDAANNVPQWEAFYVYNLDENDNLLIWTGDSSSSGNNSRGEAVTEKTGRYLVRFEQQLSRSRFVSCLFRTNLTLREVAA